MELEFKLVLMGVDFWIWQALWHRSFSSIEADFMCDVCLKID